MKWVFVGAFIVLGLLTIPAYRGSHEPVAAGKTRIVWISDDNPVRKGQIALFNKVHPEIELKLDPTNAGMEKVIVQSLAGVGPDLFDCYNPFQLSAYVRAGIASDITDDMKNIGVDVAKVIWPAVAVTCVLDDRAYGFPCNAACDAIWYNKKLFDQAKLPYPDHQMTWDELIALAKRLTIRGDDGKVKQFGMLCDWWQWQSFVAMWGGSIYSADGTKCVVDSPEAIAAVQFLHDLIYVHKVMPSPADEAAATQGGWGSGTISFFSGDKGAMAFGGRWWLCTLRMSPELRTGVTPSPFGPGKCYRGYGRSTLLSRNSKNRAAALEFLKYLAGPDYNQLLNDQGDALAPVPAYCQGDRFLHNPKYPQETYNQVWADAMAQGVPDQISPYVNGNLANRILTKQLDLVKNNQKSAADALRSAAKRINEEIAKSRARIGGAASKGGQQ